MKMKKLLLAALMLTPTAALAEPLAYPGSAWVNVTGPGVGAESGNWVTSGKIQQGIDWTDIGGWKLNTAVAVAGTVDTKGYDWNNKVVPSVSAALRKDMNGAMFEVGVQVVHEERFGRVYVADKRSATGFQAFANYWVGWGR